MTMTPAGARLSVFISAHYAPSRIRFLRTVLEEQLALGVAGLNTTLIGNDSALMSEPDVQEMQKRFADDGRRLDFAHCGPLDHPFDLTWSHKRYIRPWLHTAEANDYFVYIEDDIVLTQANIDYFLTFLGPLSKHGLIPGFLRYEDTPVGRVSVDFRRPQLIGHSRSLKLQGRTFINPNNPYWAGFILNRDLALEYVASDSFDHAASTRKSEWDVRERAAMGLTWEHVPPGYRSRYVVPLKHNRPVESCLVWHCAQNYTTAASAFGSVPLDALFRRGTLRDYAARSAGYVSRLARSALGSGAPVSND